jgi:antitoxin ChpS
MELSIRKLGNSAGIILPSTLLRSLQLSVGSSLTAEQVKGKLVLTPAAKSRYSLTELMAQCDSKAQPPTDMETWGAIDAVGKEII